MGTTSKNRLFEILKYANAVQQRFILGTHSSHDIFKELLGYLLTVSESEFGFIGQLRYDQDTPYIEKQAATKIPGDQSGTRFYDEKRIAEFDFFNLNSFRTLILKNPNPLISDDPADESALFNHPEDHHHLFNLLCYPIRHDQQLTGILCLANSLDGYHEDLLAHIMPLVTTCSVMMEGSKTPKRAISQPDAQDQQIPSGSENPISNWEWYLEKKPQYSIPEKIFKIQGWQSGKLPENLRHFFTHYIHPDDQNMILAHLRQHRDSTKSFVVQCRMLTAQGDYRWYKLSVQLLKNSAGDVARVRGMIKDIHHIQSNQDENQQLHLQTLNLQDKINSLNQALRQNLQESGVIQKQFKENKTHHTHAPESFQALRQHTHKEFHEHDEKKRRALTEERQRLTERLAVLTEALENNLLERQALRKKVDAGEQLLKNALDTYSDVFIIFDADRRIKFINQQGLAFLGVQEGQVIGKRDEDFLPDEVTHVYLPTLKQAYQLKKEQSLEGSFDTPEGTKDVLVRYIPQLDEQGNVQELLAITFDISAQKKSQHERLRAQEQYQHLFRHSPLPMWIYDLQTLHFMDANDAATRCYGWTREEFLSMRILDIRPNEDKQKLSELLTHKIDSFSNSGIWTHLRKDGSQLDAEISSHEMIFNGRKARIVLVNDVTDRLKAERLLQASKANLKATLDNGILSSVLLDKHARVVLSDNKTAQISRLVLGKEMNPGDKYQDYLPEGQTGLFYHHFDKALKGEASRFEDTVDHGPAGKFCLDVSFSPVFDTEKQVTGVVLSFLDISERKEAQEKLLESEANLKAIFDATSHSYFLLDKDHKILKFNKLAATTVWLTHAKELKEGDNMLDYTDPKLMQNFKDAVQRALLGEKISVERRVEHPSAERWYKVQYLPVANDVGRIYGVAFIAEDITHSKLTALALKKSYQNVKNFKNALYNSALITATDLKGIITEVNDKFCEVSQYKREEIIGKSHRIINSSYHPRGFFKKMWDTIQKGEIWRGDIKNKAKDGSYHWVDTFIHPIKDEQGALDHYLSVRYLITDRKVAEQETQQYAQRLDDILENITDGFFTTDRAWRFTRVNNVLEKSLQKSREELIGKVIWDTFPEAVNLRFYEAYSKTMHEGEAVHFEEYYPPLDAWFETHAYPAEDGISVYFRDITQRKKSEEEIRKLSLVASKTDNTVIITNARREIEWVNEGFTKLTGYTFDEVTGRNPGHFLQGPETDKDTVEKIRLKLLRQESLTEELINYNKEGEKYWIKMDINPIFDKKGNVEKFIAIQSNITERKQAELEKSLLLNEVIQKNQSLEDYAFITSHNLRAPVAHILGLTSLFNEEDIADPFNVTLIEQLSKASENLDSIIKDITELLAIRKDIVKVKEKTVVKDIVELVMENLQEQITQADADIQLNLDPVTEIYTVRDFLYSMLLNLLSNAIKYRQPGRRPKIMIIGSMHEKQQCISIKDNGLGINLKKYDKKIFSLYHRFHSHVEGKGMGLHLVKTLAEATGGSVKVDSQEGEGSTFTICFPAGNK